MPKLKVTKAFEWAHRGVLIESFDKGAVLDTDSLVDDIDHDYTEMLRVAKDEKWVANPKDAKGEATLAGAELQPSDPAPGAETLPLDLPAEGTDATQAAE